MASQLPPVSTEWSLKTHCNILNYLTNGSFPANYSLMLCGPAVYSLPEAIVLTILLMILLIGTAGGNMLVMLAILLVKKLRSPTNLLIVNLALTDFLVSILVLPFAIFYQVLGFWPFNQTICDFYSMCDVLLCTSSILSLCAISIDRYLAITKPLQYAARRTPRRMFFMIIISWLLSAAISIPPVYGWEKKIQPYFCGYSDELSYQIYATFTAFYIPLTVMLVLYGKIFLLARQMSASDAQKLPTLTSEPNAVYPIGNSYEAKEISPTSPNVSIACGKDEHNAELAPEEVTNYHEESNLQLKTTAKRHKKFNGVIVSRHGTKSTLVDNADIAVDGKKRSLKPVFMKRLSSRQTEKLTFKSETHKAVTTLGVIMGCFTICWLPFFLCQLVTPIVNQLFTDKPFFFPATLFQVFLWLGYANSFLNPIIYAQFNRDFRIPFLYILRCQCASINTRIRTEQFAHQFGLPGKANLGYEKSVYFGKDGSRKYTNLRNKSIILTRSSKPSVDPYNLPLVAYANDPECNEKRTILSSGNLDSSSSLPITDLATNLNGLDTAKIPPTNNDENNTELQLYEETLKLKYHGTEKRRSCASNYDAYIPNLNLDFQRISTTFNSKSSDGDNKRLSLQNLVHL